MAPESPLPLSLDDPAPLLRWLAGEGPEPEHLPLVVLARSWVRMAVAVSALQDARVRGIIDQAIAIVRSMIQGSSTEVRSLLAATLFPDGALPEPDALERRFRSAHVNSFDQIEKQAHDISLRLVPSEELEDTRHTIRYVIVELLRNAVQHSQDPRGGWVAADFDMVEQGRKMVQVTVVDLGIGIHASLRVLHPTLTSPEAALEKALWPHISGTFEEGLTGSQQNAGMGLFFIAEMAKLTGGRLLIASRGATLLLSGYTDEEGGHTLRIIKPRGTGFPGTLVVFELPTGSVVDYPALIETIKERARQRTPARVTHRWLRFEPAPAGALRIRVATQAENTTAATRVAQEELTPRILRREPVVLDFAGLTIVTQSYLHALLFEPLRLAWALRTPIYVAHTEPAVRSTLELLENYALAG